MATDASVLRKAKELLRRGRGDEALHLLDNAPSLARDAESHVLRVRFLLDRGAFRAARTTARELSGTLPRDDTEGRACLEIVGAFAEALDRPSREVRDRIRSLASELRSSPVPVLSASGWGASARLISVEVALQAAPIHALVEAQDAFGWAARAYRDADRVYEAHDELAQQADAASKVAPSASEAGRVLWDALAASAEREGDPVAHARSRLALAELALVDLLQSGDAEGAAAMEHAFEEVTHLYEHAGFRGGDADVLEVLGRCLMRFNSSEGVGLLRKAADQWLAADDIKRADASLRELETWHIAHGELDALEKARRQRDGLALHSDLVTVTNAVGEAFHSYAQGGFGDVAAAIEDGLQAAAAPSHVAALLLQEANAWASQGRQQEAHDRALRAVDALLPASPCVMLGEAHAAVAHHAGDRPEAVRALTAAAEVAAACGRPFEAALHWANLGLTVGTPIASEAADLHAAEEAFARSASLLDGLRERAALLAWGTLAQRKAQVAMWAKSWSVAEQMLRHAEGCFRMAGQNADRGFALTQLGLLQFQLARQDRQLARWHEAIRYFDDGRACFERQDLRGERLRLLYLSGAASFDSRVLLPDAEARSRAIELARQRLEEAALELESLRGGRRELDHLRSLSSLEDLAATQAKIYDLGHELACRDTDDFRASFLWLERMKSRALLDAMASSDGLSCPPDAEGGLVERERTLQTERDSLPPAPGSQRRWLAIGRALEQVWKEMEVQPSAATYARLRRGRPARWAEWHDALEKQAARPELAGRHLLTLHFHWPLDPLSGRVSVIGCRADWERPCRDVLDVDPQRLLAFARHCFEPPPGGRSPLRAMLRDLGGDTAWTDAFAALLAPVSRWSRPGDVVGLAPHGAMHGMPLTALMVDGRPLAERNAVFVMPSATVQLFTWERAASRSLPEAGPRTAVFACGLRSGPFPALPRAREEATFVAGLPALRGVARCDRDADRGSFLESLPGSDVLHFVGHGFEEDDGWSSGLRLAAGEQVTALDLHHARMRADLVTLSGCRTGCSRWRPGDEMVGLVPALIQAGASSVLASAWEVGERPTEALMQTFYQCAYGPAQMTKVDALRTAVERVREASPDLADWASFTLHGDWQ